MTTPRVIHWRDREKAPGVVYVGRAVPRLGLTGSPFANPFKIGPDGGRSDVIQRYRSWILGRPDLLGRLHELRGRPLACWCAPEACHADVIAALVDADEILRELKASGMSLEVVEGRLRLRPAQKADAALVDRLRPLKPEILALLAINDTGDLLRRAVEFVAESCRIPPDVLEAVRPLRDRRGDNETREEGRLRQAAAIERLRLDRLAFVDEARRAGVYRGG
jgi:hypothetical protein